MMLMLAPAKGHAVIDILLLFRPGITTKIEAGGINPSRLVE